MNGNDRKNTGICFEKNGFDVIRLWAAFSVMYMHYTAYALEAAQATGVMSVLRSVAGFFPGVVVLFALSGYLVSASRERSVSGREFIFKRVVRLYPELWICTLVNLGMLAVLARERLDPGILKWIATQIVGIANTPDSMKDFATGSLNGALWSIFVMIQLYGTVYLLHGWFSRLKMKHWMILLAAGVAVNAACGAAEPFLPSVAAKLLERTFVPYYLWFLIGAFCYHQRNRMIPVLKKWTVPMLLAYCVLQKFGGVGIGYYADVLISLLCSFLCIGAGYCIPKIRIRTDLSYGIFLYHWIVLNVWVHSGWLTGLHWLMSVAVYTACVLGLSALSTVCVGRPAGKFIARMLSRASENQ